MNLEYYELPTLTSGEAMRLFDCLRNEGGQVVSITKTPGGDLVVVTPFSADETRQLLESVAGQIQDGSVH